MTSPDRLAPAPVAPRSEQSQPYTLHEHIPHGVDTLLVMDPGLIEHQVGWKGIAPKTEREAALLVQPNGTYTVVAKPFYQQELREKAPRAAFVGTRGPFNPHVDVSVYPEILGQPGQQVTLGIEAHNLRVAEAKALEQLGIDLVDIEPALGLVPQQTSQEIVPPTLTRKQGQRIARLRHMLREIGVEHMFVTNPADVYYLSGGKKPPTNSKTKDMSPDEVLIVSSHFPAIFKVSRSDQDIARMAAYLQAPTMGIQESNMTVAEANILHDLGIKPIDIQAGTLRREKDEWEIEQLRAACEIGDKAFEHVLEMIGPDMKDKTERGVTTILNDFMREQKGFDGFSFPTLACFGPNAAKPHHEGDATPLINGNFLVLDYGAMVNGYHADMTRTIYLGHPDEEARRKYVTVLRAQQKALDLLKTGKQVSAAEVDQVANDYIIKHGMPGGTEHSHAIGMSDHEDFPSFTEGSTDLIGPHMALTVEPGSYEEGVYGIRVEDEIVTTETGYDLLTHASKDFYWIDMETGQRGVYTIADLLTEFPEA